MYKKKLSTLLTPQLPKQQTTKFSSANFQKMLNPSYIILSIPRLEGKECKSRRGGSFSSLSLEEIIGWLVGCIVVLRPR